MLWDFQPPVNVHMHCWLWMYVSGNLYISSVVYKTLLQIIQSFFQSLNCFWNIGYCSTCPINCEINTITVCPQSARAMFGDDQDSNVWGWKLASLVYWSLTTVLSSIDISIRHWSLVFSFWVLFVHLILCSWPSFAALCGEPWWQML